MTPANTADSRVAPGPPLRVRPLPRYGWPDEYVHVVRGRFALCGVRVEPEDMFTVDSGPRAWQDYVEVRCPECAQAVGC